MSSESFLPPFSSDRTRLPRVRRKRRGEKVRDRSRISLEALEPRTLLASNLPAVTVQSTPILNSVPTQSQNDPLNISDPSQNPNGNTNYNNAYESSPSVVIDQADPQKMVAVWTTYDPSHSTISVGDPNRQLQADVQGAYSNDGGQHWNNFTIRGSLHADPTLNPTPQNPAYAYNWITDAGIGFDSNNESFYVTYLEHNNNSGGSAGELAIRQFSFTTASPQVQAFADGSTEKLLYEWAPGTNVVQALYTPTVAVDGNVPAFTDTDVNGQPYTQSDPYSGNVYVAWVEQDAFYNGTRDNIVMIGSSDQGDTFTTPTIVNDNYGNIPANTDNYSPRIAIAQGRPEVKDASGKVTQTAIPGGQVSIVWDANTRNTNTDTIAVNTASGDVAAANFDSGNINSYIKDGDTTTYDLQVDATGGDFTVSDLNVELAIDHPNVDQLKITLTPPASSGITTPVTLYNGGATGRGLGRASGNGSFVGLILDDQAPRGFFAAAGATGRYQPSGNFSAFNNKSLSDLSGTWTLTITDNKADNNGNPPAPQFLHNWTLQFSHGLTFAGQTTVATTGFRGSSPQNGSGSTTSDPFGITPSPAIAIDNTLGAYSPTSIITNGTSQAYISSQGTMYVAYVYHDPNGNAPDAVRLARSFDGGSIWNAVTATDGSRIGVRTTTINDDNPYADGFSGGNKLYLMPSLAVDNTTGTLVASWYDGRYDPSHARLAMMVAASNDGGASFSPNQYVNTALTAQDGITNQTLTRGPLLDNQSKNVETNFSYGIHQGLAVYGGQVVPVWSGNLNGNLNGAQKLDVLTSQVRVTGGPRVLSGTMGPIGQSGDSVNSGRVILAGPEAANAAVGTPILSRIQVTFDRPVAFDLTPSNNPDAFDPTDVNVYYEKNAYDANGNLTGSQFIAVPVASLTALDTNAQGTATTFYVNLAQAQTAVGVYVYTIAASLKDKIRTYDYATQSTSVPASVGASMDQNADGSGGAASPGNAFAMPSPNNLGNLASSLSAFPSGPFSRDTVPIIIPGPYITNTYVDPLIPDSGANLVQNQTVSQIYVTFDRFVDISTFTPNLILRMMGPTGDITTSAGPFTISAVDPDGNGSASTFKISFTNAVQYSGTYTVQISPGVKTKPVGTAPAYGMDTNLNAGLDILRGGAGATNEQSTTVTKNAVGASGLGTVPDAATDPVTGQVTGPGIGVFNLNFNEDFPIPQPSEIGFKSVLTVQFSISTQKDHDLTAVLIAPNGDWITLLNQVTATGSGANFSNTVIDDNATANIQNGGAPFFGSYTPGGSLPSADVLASLGLDPANAHTNLTSLAADVGHSGGAWKLALVDNTKNNIQATLTAWSLSIQKPTLKSGMNEAVADQYTSTFRIFTMDPTNPLSSNTWTALGPASIGGSSDVPGGGAGGTGGGGGDGTGGGAGTADDPGAEVGGRSGRITGLAVDRSDPSGNTVYVGGSSGGVWKSTDFLRPGGPTYIPLTNFGPNNAINIGGIDIFPRNDDPNQSVIFAATGEGDTQSAGAGILRSMDGGATWQVLDSTNNVDANGNLLPIDSPNRDHAMVGNYSYKLTVDPNPTASGGIVVYVAMSGPDGGLWRSVDSGNHWALLRAGQATDLALDLNSGIGIPTDNGVVKGPAQNIWVAFRGEGVFFSNAQGQNLQLKSGGVGSPLIQAIENNPPARYLGVGNTGTNPNGPQGRIVLANPSLTGNAAEDLGYEGWLYVGVVDPGGHFVGLYQTKDFGDNWAQLRIPEIGSDQDQKPTNNTNLPDFKVTDGGGKAVQGNYDFTLATDAQNPNIVYMGGTADFSPSGLIRVDATLASDAHALVPFANDRPDGGTLLHDSTGPVSVADLTKVPTNFQGNYYYNLIHDPSQPFTGNSTLYVNNGYNKGAGTTSQFTNDGSGITWIPFDIGGTDQHRMITMRDPVTGYTRVIIGDDQGVFSIVDKDGVQIQTVGSNPAVTASRNGNLQITQFYYGAAQPDGSAFYGSAQDNGGPIGTGVLNNGSLVWSGPGGDAGGVATDPQGVGTLYQYWWPCCGGNGTEFFQVNGTGRTFGLFLSSDQTQINKQWPFTGGANFTVNPLSGQQVLISDFLGNIFRTENQGVLWTQIAAFGSKSNAMAYGAPDPNSAAGAGNLDNFLYVGTVSGKIYVSQNGGGTWTDISAGLTGSIQSIVTNPTRGSHEAYAVTSNGVFHIADSTAAGATWQNITGNLFQLRRNVFPNGSNSFSVSTLNQDVQPLYLPIPPAYSDTNTSVTEHDLNITGHVGQTVGDLSVTLNSLNVSNLGALKIVLIAPDNKTQITLFDGTGATGTQFLNTTFSDFGSPLSSGGSPYSGSYQPSGASKLSVFNGQYVEGTWRLLIYNSSTSNTGTVGNFSLNFSDGNSQAAGGLTSLAVDWRYNLPDDPANPSTDPTRTHPAIYAGGVGGVFRSFNDGQSWSLFPDGVTSVTGAVNASSANNSPLGDGGGLSTVHVSDLDMVLGKIDPTTGQPAIDTGPNLLLATTYGQGSFGIRISPITIPNIAGQTPYLSIDHTDGYSDTGSSSTDGVTSNQTPYITGYSEQTAYGNVVTVRFYDQTPNSPTFGQLVGIGQTDGFGKFRVQIAQYNGMDEVLDPSGNPIPVPLFQYNGQKILGVQATDAAGTIGNMTLVGNTLSPIYLELNAPNPATIALAPGNDTGNAGDNVTNPNLIVTSAPDATTGALTFTVTIDGSVQNGSVTTPTATLMRLDQNGIYVPVPGSTVNIPITGTPNLPITVQLTDPGPFTNGYAYTYAVRIVDALNNVYDPNGDPDPKDQTAPYVTTVIIDTTAPAPGLISLDPSSDSGLNISVSGTTVTTGVSDNVTNPNLITGPTAGQLVFDVQISSKDRGSSLYLVRKSSSGVYTIVNPDTPVVANNAPDPTTGRVPAQLVDPGPFGPTGVPDDTYTYYVQIVDVAGNTYDPQTDPNADNDSTKVVTDTTTPPAASISLDPASDSGTKGDNITNPTLVSPANQLTFDILIPAADQYSLVSLYRNNLPVGNAKYAVSAPVGGFVTVYITDPGPFTGGIPNPDGSYYYNYTVKYEDRAGNFSDVNTPLKITIAGVNPNQGVLILDPSSDTGLSGTDGITSPALTVAPSTPGTLLFNLTLDKNNPGQISNDTGATVYLLRSSDGGANYSRVGTSVLTTKDPASGLPVAQLVDPGPFPTGVYTYQVEVINKAGVDNKEAATAITVTIDSTTPDPTSVGVTLDPSSDSGLNISVDGSGTVTTGVLDGYTNPYLSVNPTPNGTINITVTLAVVDLGSQVTLMRSSDGGATYSAVGTPALATQTDANGNPYVVINDPGPFDAADVADGTYLYSAQVEDVAGNTDDPKLTTPQTVVIDTTIPAPAVFKLDPNSDTGISNSDGVTNPQTANPAGQLVFDVTIAGADQNSLLTLFRNGVQVGTPVYATGAIDPVSGKITANLVDPGPFSDGQYTYTVQIEDRAGNFDDAASRQSFLVTVDGVKPSITSLVLDPASDSADPSGRSHSDDYTNPVFSSPQGSLTFDVILGSPTDAGSKLTLMRDGVAVGAPVTATIDPTTGLATAKITDPGPLTPDGVYTYSVSVIDSAGNADDPSTRPTLSVTIDTTAPKQPSVPVLDRNNPSGGSDSGIVGDNVTNVNRPYFTGTAEAGSLVQVVDSSGTVYGQAVVNALGVYTVQTGTKLANGTYTALPDGVYTFYAKSYDLAGNPSPRSGASATIKIDTAPITPLPTLKLVASDDTAPGGKTNTDNITSVQSPHLQGTGKVDPNNQLHVQIIDLDGNIPGDLPAAGIATGGIVTNPDGTMPLVLVQPDGTFQVQIKRVLPGGVYHLVARTYKPDSGNYADSAPLTLTILVLGQNSNLNAPTSFGLNPADDTGTKGDNITSTRLYRLIGKADPNTLVELFQVGANPNQPLDTTTSAPDGSFTLRPPAVFVNGSISYYAREVDVAGNLGPVAPSNPNGLTITSINTTGDFNGDGKADAITYNRSSGTFSQTLTGSSVTTTLPAIIYNGRTLSGPNFIPIEGDFGSDGVLGNGDGKADYGVYDYSTATFYIELSSSSGTRALAVKQFGWGGHDVPLTADFNGDGTTDFVVYRPDNSTFYAQLSDGTSFAYQFGSPGDQPLVGDFNGDGKADFAVYRPASARWLIQYTNLTANGQTPLPIGGQDVYFGWGGVDQAAPADFNGDGKTDIAVYRPVGSNSGQNQGQFLIQGMPIQSVGVPGQVTSAAIPVALDFNGDGKADTAVYQPSTSQWSFQLSDGASKTSTLGAPGGIPLGAPLSYRMATSSGSSSALFNGDFNGDGLTDPTTYNPSSGTFSQTLGGSSVTTTLPAITYNGQTLSGPNYIPFEGDFNGDGKADYGVFDYSTATYYIEQSSSSGAPNLVVKQFGWGGHDLPLMADFNGDGATDFAVYRPDNSTFYVQLSGGGGFAYQFGWAGHDQPIVGDFNGDGKTDFAVYRPASAEWFVQYTSLTASGQNPQAPGQYAQFGWGGVDKAAPADFNGDGKTDFAVYRPVGSNPGQNQAQFLIQGMPVQSVGAPGQVTSAAIPVVMDFNGDGRADTSVYQPSTSQWSFQLSDGTSSTSTLGAPGGIPLGAPLSYRMTSGTVTTASVGNLTNFQAAPAPTPAPASTTTTAAISTPITAPATTASVPQAAVGTSRMALIRRLMAHQKQAKLQQALLARRASAQAAHQVVPGGLLALQNRWRFRA